MSGNASRMFHRGSELGSNPRGAARCGSVAHPADSDLLVLIEAEPQAISQDSTTANDHYLVSKTRLQMKRHCMTSEAAWAEVKQFDQWSFGERLLYSRKKQAAGLAGGSQRQDGVQDPLQDQRQDPWNKDKTKPEQEEGKKETRPQEFLLTPQVTPTRKSKDSGSPAPGLEIPEAADKALNSITRPSK